MAGSGALYGRHWMIAAGLAFTGAACSSETDEAPGAGGSLSAGASGTGASGGSSNSAGGSTSSGGSFAGASGAATTAGGAAGTSGTANGGAAGDGGSGGTQPSSGGTGGAAPFDPPFILGADVSSVPEWNPEFVDTDGQSKSLFALLKNHGFNYVRLRTFVDPSAPYGYASDANGCAGKSESFGDAAHVIAFGAEAKAAGMGFLLDFHYSDVWADPGNQIIPAAWRDASTVAELAERMKQYTREVLLQAIAQGARPDMVQVGNETTPGLLMHVPGPDTDCWGNNPVAAPLGGSTSNWDDLATLLKAGIEAVREVDPRIRVMLHVENTDDLEGIEWWVESARSRGVDFDVLGLSCYTAFQGQPSMWRTTFEALAESYPELEFAIAEYNPERTAANLLMSDLPGGRGLGTFIWEPTQGGEWGPSLFTAEGNVLRANAADFAEYDALRGALGL